MFRYGHTDHRMPRVIIVSSIHGNEPSGLRALLELKPMLRKLSAQLNGEVIGLIGNFKALELNKRFIDKDLNRMWNPADEELDIAESQEKDELHSLLKDFLSGEGPRYVLDLHTTSSDSSPFMSIADTEANLSFASEFSVPAIAGIERFINGALLEYVSTLGHVGLAFEAGQHIDPRSVDRHIEFIMEALHHSGVHRDGRFDEVTSGREYDIIFRHGIESADEFVMNPGYENFSPVHKGQILAHDRNGDIRSPKDGFLFMPLYQSEGSDGFFIIR